MPLYPLLIRCVHLRQTKPGRLPLPLQGQWGLERGVAVWRNLSSNNTAGVWWRLKIVSTWSTFVYSNHIEVEQLIWQSCVYVCLSVLKCYKKFVFIDSEDHSQFKQPIRWPAFATLLLYMAIRRPCLKNLTLVKEDTERLEEKYHTKTSICNVQVSISFSSFFFFST